MPPVTPKRTCSLFDVGELRRVADVASRPSGPVDVSALCASPVFGRKQPAGLFSRVLADLDAQLLLRRTGAG